MMLLLALWLASGQPQSSPNRVDPENAPAVVREVVFALAGPWLAVEPEALQAALAAGLADRRIVRWKSCS